MNAANSEMPRRAEKAPSRFEPRAADAQRRVFEVLVNPENDRKPEAEKATLAGMAPRTWRKHRTQELASEALAARRAAYVRHLPAIDAALLRKALEGSLQHILIFYERVEGWRPGGSAPERNSAVSGPDLWQLITPEVRQALAEVVAQGLRGRSLPAVASPREDR